MKVILSSDEMRKNTAFFVCVKNHVRVIKGVACCLFMLLTFLSGALAGRAFYVVMEGKLFMKTRKMKIVYLILSVLMIAALCVSGILEKQKIWESLSMKYTNKSAKWTLDKGDQYGIVSTGPDFRLPPGEYKLKWRMDGDGINRIHLKAGDMGAITPSLIETTPGMAEEEATFVVHETTQSFNIEVEFCAGSKLSIQNFRMYSPVYADLYISLGLIVVAACLLWYAYERGWLTQERISTLTILGVMTVLSARLYLQDNSPTGWDTAFHAQRIMNLADGLRSGQFPVIAGGFSYNGYGAMTSVFYGDMLLYPWALMHMAGASMSYILNTLAIAANACAAGCMYIAVKGLLRDKSAAVCSSLLFLGCAHWLKAMYRRFALGEMFGMAFLPLFLFALYEVIFGDRKYWKLLAISAMLIFRSHILTTVFCAVIAVGMGVLSLGKIIKEKRLPAIGCACLFAVLLNLNQLLPMLMSYLDGVNTSVYAYKFTDYTYLPSYVLDIRLGIGFTSVLGAAAYVCMRGRLENERQKHIGDLCLMGGLVFMLMTTDLIPWSYVDVIAGSVLDTLQFPERFLIPGSVMLAICGGMGMCRIAGKDALSSMLLTLVIAVAFSVPYAEEVIGMVELDYGQSFSAEMGFPEYQIEGTNVNDTSNREPIVRGDAQVTQYEKQGTQITARIEAVEESEIVFPLFGFGGYAAELDGKRMDWFRGDNNCIAIRVPAQTSGELKIWFAGKGIWRAADVVTFVSLIGLAVCCARKRRVACK